MKIEQFINQLKDIHKEHGNIDVYMRYAYEQDSDLYPWVEEIKEPDPVFEDLNNEKTLYIEGW